MTQQDLIQLIGLRATDSKVVAHFEQQGLGKPPRSITSNQRTKIVYDKERNLYYAFSFEVFNDQFYPPIDTCGKYADYKFVPFLTEISFLYKEPSAKKPDPKEAGFWNVTPPPQAPVQEIAAWFSAPEGRLNRCHKLLNDVIEINVAYDDKKKVLTQNWARIIEHSEIISHYFLEEDRDLLGHTAHLYAMMLKWLFDNRYLVLEESIYSDPLPVETDTVLSFARDHLHNHLWDNQITREPHLRSFLYTAIHNFRDTKDEKGKTVDFYFRNVILRQAGKLEALDPLHSGQNEAQKELYRSILFNEQTYAAFYREMNKQFDYFKKLTDLNA